MACPSRSFLSISLVAAAAGAALAAQVPTLDQLFSKAGISDKSWVSRPEQAKISRKLQDAAAAKTEQRARTLTKEAENRVTEIAKVCDSYVACGAAIENEDAAGKARSCSSAALGAMEPVIDPPKLQELKRLLGLEQLPGGSCNEDEQFACSMKCSTIFICPCCQD